MKVTVLPRENLVTIWHKDNEELKMILDALSGTGKVEEPVKVTGTTGKQSKR